VTADEEEETEVIMLDEACKDGDDREECRPWTAGRRRRRVSHALI